MLRPSYDPNAIHPSLVPPVLLEAVQFALGKLADERPDDPIAYFAQCLLDTTPERRAALAKAAEEDAEKQRELLMATQKKFKELDVNGNGLLEGDELIQLGKWVLSEFEAASGQPLGERAQAELGIKLLRRVDSNADHEMDFDEFKGWFEKILLQLARFRRHAADRTKWVYRGSSALESKTYAATETCTFEQARTIMANNPQYNRFVFTNVKSQGGRRPTVPVQMYFLTPEILVPPVPSEPNTGMVSQRGSERKSSEGLIDRFNSRAARRVSSASKPPAIWHCWMAEKPQVLTPEDMAAVKIQRMARGRLQRKKFKQDRDAAVKLQSQMRGHLARKTLKLQAIQGIAKQNLLLEGVFAIDGVEFLVVAEVVTANATPYWQFTIYDRASSKKQLEHVFLLTELEELKECLDSVQNIDDEEQRKVFAEELLKLFKVDTHIVKNEIVNTPRFDGPVVSGAPTLDSLSQFSGIHIQSPKTPSVVSSLPLPLPLPLPSSALNTPLPAPRVDYDTLQRPETAGEKEKFASPSSLALEDSALPSRPMTAGDKEKPSSSRPVTSDTGDEPPGSPAYVDVSLNTLVPPQRPHTAGEKEKPVSPGSLGLGSPLPEVHGQVLVISGSPLPSPFPSFDETASPPSEGTAEPEDVSTPSTDPAASPEPTPATVGGDNATADTAGSATATDPDAPIATATATDSDAPTATASGDNSAAGPSGAAETASEQITPAPPSLSRPASLARPPSLSRPLSLARPASLSRPLSLTRPVSVPPSRPKSSNQSVAAPDAVDAEEVSEPVVGQAANTTHITTADSS